MPCSSHRKSSALASHGYCPRWLIRSTQSPGRQVVLRLQVRGSERSRVCPRSHRSVPTKSECPQSPPLCHTTCRPMSEAQQAHWTGLPVGPRRETQVAGGLFCTNTPGVGSYLPQGLRWVGVEVRPFLPPLLKRCLSVLTSCCHPDKSRGGGGVLTSAGNNGRKLGTENHPIRNLPHTFQTPARLNEQHGAHDADPRSPWMCRPAERAGAGSTFDICGSGLESLAKERFFLTIVRNMNYPESLL